MEITLEQLLEIRENLPKAIGDARESGDEGLVGVLEAFGDYVEAAIAEKSPE